jgi:histidinol phosphatase-like PHP family hydrolase
VCGLNFMVWDLLRRGEGRFFRGNLHCHSDRSDGQRHPEEVVAAYRDAGYDFIVLSDHFEAEYDWRITDTRTLRDASFTTIVGAELSSGPWGDRNTYWVVAAGLPLDFAPPPRHDHAEAIQRARDSGAFVVMLHPGLNNLPVAVVNELPALEALHAIEIYNHNMASGALPDGAHGAYMLEGLLEKGHRVFVNAGDDAHFDHARDRFGGWVEVHCESLDPNALLDSLKSGSYYSTQGPSLYKLEGDGASLRVETSAAYTIVLSGAGNRWMSATSRFGDDEGLVTEADFDLTPFRGSYCRVTVVDREGRKAWSNPVWP